MAKRRPIRVKGDVREFPRYSIAEAAFYIRVPASTLKAWTRGQNYTTRDGFRRTFQPVLLLADQENKLLSFSNLVEAHILRSFTEKGVPLKNMRKALEYIRHTIGGDHPLLSPKLELIGVDVLIRHLGLTIRKEESAS